MIHEDIVYSRTGLGLALSADSQEQVPTLGFKSTAGTRLSDAGSSVTPGLANHLLVKL